VQPGVSALDSVLRSGNFAEEIISALETRAYWARYGL
jgi:hypothetical protein